MALLRRFLPRPRSPRTLAKLSSVGWFGRNVQIDSGNTALKMPFCDLNADATIQTNGVTKRTKMTIMRTARATRTDLGRDNSPRRAAREGVAPPLARAAKGARSILKASPQNTRLERGYHGQDCHHSDRQGGGVSKT